MPKYSKQERADALARLRDWLKPGDTVYTIVENVARSGMSREIRAVLLQPADSGRVRNGYAPVVDLHPNHAIATVLGYRQGKRDGCIVGGCGMDMGFHLVYNLSYTLFPDGFDCIGEGCNSNDHSNGDRDRTPHRHKDGGYALKQRWL